MPPEYEDNTTAPSNTWSANTFTDNTVWIQDNGEHDYTTQPTYPSYTISTASSGITVDEAQMKRLIKEALKEVMDEDQSFEGFLIRKYK